MWGKLLSQYKFFFVAIQILIVIPLYVTAGLRLINVVDGYGNNNFHLRINLKKSQIVVLKILDFMRM